MASNDNDEDDYMSDAFLAKCEDPRPGLVFSRPAAHKSKVEKRCMITDQLNQTKSKKVLEKEKREEGLTTALDQSNKGFALMAKMGYKPGMGIGKTGSGRKEPVPVHVRARREGLGVEEKRKRKYADMEVMRARMAIKRANLANDFHARLAEQRMEKETERDLRSSQSVCFQLDSEEGIEEPDFHFYWPALARPSQKAQVEEVEEGLPLQKGEGEEDEERLPSWTGERRENEDRLPSSQKWENDEEQDEFNEEDDEEDKIPPSEKLVQITSYLRRTYLYCVWCGTKYDDKEDMSLNCPGDTRGIHDD